MERGKNEKKKLFIVEKRVKQLSLPLNLQFCFVKFFPAVCSTPQCPVKAIYIVIYVESYFQVFNCSEVGWPVALLMNLNDSDSGLRDI